MMVRIAWAVLALAAPAVAGTQAAPTLYDQGVAARRAGDAARAATLLGQAVRADPASADAQLQYGYALLALGRLGEADAAFAASLRLAPAYDDARVGRALVAERRGDLGAARAFLAPVAAEHVEGAALRTRLAGAPLATSWTLDLDATATHLAGQPDWRQFDAQLSRRLAGGAVLAGRVEAARRFGRGDVYGEVRGEVPLGPTASVYLLAGATPHADFRPRWQLGAGGRVRAHGGATPTVLTFDARHAAYRSGKVTLLNPGIEQYIAKGRAWLTAQSINLLDHGKVRMGALGRADVMASDRLRLFGGAADAPDVDQGIVVRTRTYFAGASLALGPRTDVRLSGAFDRPDRGARRASLSLGTTVRF
jgi:YaiO family outer membrane protein